jgi:hypothetical protein
LFDKSNFRHGGAGFRMIFQDEPSLKDHDFNNRTSSVVVLRGSWRLYENSDYAGERSRRLRPGLYPDVSDVGIPKNRVSSLRCRDD